MKRLVMAVTALAVVSVQAMPTKAELTKAQPLVVELMTPSMNAFQNAAAKDKAVAAVKVGDASSEFAKSAETEAARFLLLKGAVSYYARGEAYDKAADAVAELQRTVKDVPPSAIAEIAGKATGKISETKAPRLYAQYRAAKLQVKAESEAKTLATKLKKVKSDVLQRRYAEALAVSGDWKAAYAEFAKLSNAQLKAIVEAEASGKVKNAEAGEFWWSYEPSLEDADDFFKSHAATFYRQALAAGEITGLKKNIVEQRIAGMAIEVVSSREGNATGKEGGTIDLKNGKDSPFTVNGNVAVLKLKCGYEIEFVRCPAGEFDMSLGCGTVQRVRLTRPYWISKTPIAESLDCDLNDATAIRNVGNKRYLWRKGAAKVLGVVERFQQTFGSCLPKGYVIRPPSIAELQYAFCANESSKDSPYNYPYLRDQDRGKVFLFSAPKGAVLKPNAWGLYDFAGCEFVADCVDRDSVEKWESKESGKYVGLPRLNNTDDPFYWSRDEVPTVHLMFRSAWCTSHDGDGAVHLVIGPDLVSERKAKRSEMSGSSSGKAWQENGNTATLTLPNGEKLEFAKCPAGRADMRIGIKDTRKYPKSKSVTITRPFWVMVRPLVRRNYKGYPAYSTMLGGRSDDPFNYCEGYYDQVMEFANTLTAELKDSLPKGYVVRLPSFAEWDYSFRAGSRDPNDPYSNFDVSRDPKNVARCRETLLWWGKDNLNTGKTRKNNWGLHEYWTKEKLLDRVGLDNAIPDENGWHDGENNGGDVVALKAEAIDDEDPLLWSESEKSYPLQRHQRDFRGVGSGNKWCYSRLVVGPDLVSEWKAKHGKK